MGLDRPAKTTSLAISLQFFHSKLKTLLFTTSYPDSSSSPTSLPISTPNTIHHSCLTVCQPDSLDLKGHCIMTSGQKWPFWTHPPTHPVRLGKVSLDPPTPHHRDVIYCS